MLPGHKLAGGFPAATTSGRLPEINHQFAFDRGSADWQVGRSISEGPSGVDRLIAFSRTAKHI
jgi:hypothetical protein